MSVTLHLTACRQNAERKTVVMWSGGDASARGFQLVLASKRLPAEDVARALAEGHPDVRLVDVPASAGAVADDLTPAGQPCYYGVVAIGSDGSRKASRFRAAPMTEWPEGTVRLSELAPAGTSSPTFEEPPRGRPGKVDADEKLAARKRAQAKALEAAMGREEASAEPARRPALRPPSDYPVDRFGLPMIGATQTWDGVRVLWEAERFEAEAYEVFIADRRLEADEAAALLRGEEISGAWVRAFPPEARVVIDNLTPRESRGWYAVVARAEGGLREVLGCTAQGSDECRVVEAPFFDPDRLEEVREMAEQQVREARAQLHWWQAEQDAGAWREALRLCGDALAILPGHPAAAALRNEIERMR